MEWPLIVGLGWGRATRTVTLSDAASAAVTGEEMPEVAPTSGALVVGADGPETPGDEPRIGEPEPDELAATDLFNPATTGRVIV